MASDWSALHSGKHNEEVQLCAFDVLAMDGDHLRDLTGATSSGTAGVGDPLAIRYKRYAVSAIYRKRCKGKARPSEKVHSQGAAAKDP